MFEKSIRLTCVGLGDARAMRHNSMLPGMRDKQMRESAPASKIQVQRQGASIFVSHSELFGLFNIFGFRGLIKDPRLGVGCIWRDSQVCFVSSNCHINWLFEWLKLNGGDRLIVEKQYRVATDHLIKTRQYISSVSLVSSGKGTSEVFTEVMEEVFKGVQQQADILTSTLFLSLPKLAHSPVSLAFIYLPS